MIINSLKIDGVGGIKHLELHFNKGMNIICGANGIGKTTILDVISDAFSANISSKLKRNALCEIGKYFIEMSRNESGKQILECKEERVEKFQPDAGVFRRGWQMYSSDLLYFGIDRNINYSKLGAVTSDPERKDYINGSMAVTGIKADDIKNWFVNRYLFVGKKDSLTEEQISNFNRRCTTCIDRRIQTKQEKNCME